MSFLPHNNTLVICNILDNCTDRSCYACLPRSASFYSATAMIGVEMQCNRTSNYMKLIEYIPPILVANEILNEK